MKIQSKAQGKEKIMIGQEIENRDKNLDKIQSTLKPYDVAVRVTSYVQGYFKVGQSLSNPINISFSKPQPILDEQSDSSSGGYYYYADILKNNYKYQISITIGHYPLKKMATEWDISYAVRRCKHKLSLSDKLTGVKSHHSEYVKGDYLKTIDASTTNQDDLITEISVSSIYLLEDLIEKYINGNSRQKNTVRTTRGTVLTKIFEKLESMNLQSVFRHRLSFIQNKNF
jgi:hypothetical protein